MRDAVKAQDRPFVICHMSMSLDGRVTGDFLRLPQCEAATRAYYRINREYGAGAFACGRVTMEESFTLGHRPDLSRFDGSVIPPMDHVADENASFFAVAVWAGRRPISRMRIQGTGALILWKSSAKACLRPVFPISTTSECPIFLRERMRSICRWPFAS